MRLGVVVFFVVVCPILYGQGEFLHVKFSDGGESQYYPIDAISKLTYTPSSLLIHLNEGEPVEVPFTALRYYNYDTPSSVETLPVDPPIGQLRVFPNPSRGNVRIQCELHHEADIRVVIHDASGREAESLYRGRIPSGVFEQVWDTSKHPAGMYICRVMVGNQSMTQRILVLP